MFEVELTENLEEIYNCITVYKYKKWFSRHVHTPYCLVKQKFLSKRLIM